LGYLSSDGAIVSWQGNDTGIPINQGSPAKLNGAVTDPGPAVDWIDVRQDGHLLIQGFPASPDLALLSHRLAYREPGGSPETSRTGKSIASLGYEITRLERLSAGKHVFDVCFAVLDGNVHPDRFMAELRSPVETLPTSFAGAVMPVAQ
jgi:hypothetical protein